MPGGRGGLGVEGLGFRGWDLDFGMSSLGNWATLPCSTEDVGVGGRKIFEMGASGWKSPARFRSSTV